MAEREQETEVLKKTLEKERTQAESRLQGYEISQRELENALRLALEEKSLKDDDIMEKETQLKSEVSSWWWLLLLLLWFSFLFLIPSFTARTQPRMYITTIIIIIIIYDDQQQVSRLEKEKLLLNTQRDAREKELSETIVSKDTELEMTSAAMKKLELEITEIKAEKESKDNELNELRKSLNETDEVSDPGFIGYIYIACPCQ